ncbi:MAG TPA: hypothetical protein VHU84_00375 [Lacipirellulaceae bacterium]|jgi:hypothetical protein|nr:hypothetical protein [Lacipirellulaceae bacterium]
MFFEQIEQLKRDYTDKYVVVDATRPELARFGDVVGRVKTVNMSGRALVEFDDYHVNIGWYDIDPEFLKVVDKPPPKAPKAEAKKAAPKAAPAATEKPAAKSAAPAAKAGRPSVADMLAAARGGSGPAKSAAAAPAKAKSSAAPAGAKPAGAPVDRSKMSVADMLAAARAGGAAGAAPAATPAAAPAAAPAPAPAKMAAPATAKSTEKVDKSKMSIDDMVAWCREHDTK